MINYQLTLFIGNEKCYVSYADEESEIKFINEDGDEGFQTSIWFNGQSRFFGKEAVKKARTNPVKFYRNLISELNKNREDRRKFEFNGREFGPKGLLALILIDIKKKVCAKLKLDPRESLKVLLVVPQYVTNNIAEIKTACHYSNIKVVSVLPEPMAVCCAYRVFPEDRKRAIVVDLSSEFKIDFVEGVGNEYKILKSTVNLQFGYSTLVKKLKEYVLMRIKNDTGSDFEECATDEDKIDLDIQIEESFKKLIDSQQDNLSVEMDLNFPGIYKGRILVSKNENDTQDSVYDVYDDGWIEETSFNIISKIKSESSSIGSMVAAFIEGGKCDVLLLQGKAVRLKPIVNAISKNLNNINPKVIPSRAYSPYLLPSIGGAQWYSLKGEKALEDESALSDEDRELGEIISAVSSGDSKKSHFQSAQNSIDKDNAAKHNNVKFVKSGERENISEKGFKEISFLLDDPSCFFKTVVEYSQKSVEQDSGRNIKFSTVQMDEFFNNKAENIRIIAFSRDKKSISEKTFNVEVFGDKNGWLKYQNIYGTGGKTEELCLFRIYKYKNDLKIETTAEIYESKDKHKTVADNKTAECREIQLGEKISINETSNFISLSVDEKDIEICAVEFGSDCNVKSVVGKSIKEINRKIVKWNDNEITVDLHELNLLQEINEIRIFAKSRNNIEIGRRRYNVLLKDNAGIFARYKNESTYNIAESVINVLRIYKHKGQTKIAVSVDEKLDGPSAKAVDFVFNDKQDQKNVLSENTVDVLDLGTKIELVKSFEDLSIFINSKDIQIIDLEKDKDGSVLKKGHVQKIKKQNGVSIRIKDLISDTNVKELSLFVTGLNNKQICNIEFEADLSINGSVKYRYNNRQIKVRKEDVNKFSRMLLFHIYERSGRWWLKTAGDLE